MDSADAPSSARLTWQGDPPPAPHRTASPELEPPSPPRPPALDDVDARGASVADGALGMLIEGQHALRLDLHDLAVSIRDLREQGGRSDVEVAALRSAVTALATESAATSAMLTSVISELRTELRVVREELQGVRRRMPVSTRR